MKKMGCLLLCAALCVGVCSCSPENKEKKQVNSVVTAMGNVATLPSAINVFSTTDLEGNVVTNDFFSQADLTVVNFWGTFCNPCIDEMPELAQWAEDMPDNVQMLGVVVDAESADSEEYTLAKQIIEKTGVTYTNVMAKGAFDQFLNNLAGVPTTVFIDKDGKVVGDAVVGAKVEAYKQSVEDYLNEQK